MDRGPCERFGSPEARAAPRELPEACAQHAPTGTTAGSLRQGRRMRSARDYNSHIPLTSAALAVKDQTCVGDGCARRSLRDVSLVQPQIERPIDGVRRIN